MTASFIYSYTLALHLNNLTVQEYFVTFEEPNLFVEPYDNLWIKLAATVIYLFGICGAFIQYSFVLYEANGYLASFRTVINQLVSSGYFIVSLLCFKLMEHNFRVCFSLPLIHLWLLD